MGSLRGLINPPLSWDQSAGGGGVTTIFKGWDASKVWVHSVRFRATFLRVECTPSIFIAVKKKGPRCVHVKMGTDILIRFTTKATSSP